MYSPLCRPTGQLWEGGALEDVRTKPTGTTIGLLPAASTCLQAMIFLKLLLNQSGVVGDYAHGRTKYEQLGRKPPFLSREAATYILVYNSFVESITIRSHSLIGLTFFRRSVVAER